MRKTPHVVQIDIPKSPSIKVKKGVVYPAFDPDIPWDKMEPILGMRFETPHQLKMALANYGVAHGYQLWYMKNDWRQVLVYCGRNIDEGRCAGKKGNKHRVLPRKVRTRLFRGDEGNQASKKPVKKPIKKVVKKPVKKIPDSQSGEGTMAMNKLAFSLEDTITPSIRKRLEILKEKQREWVVYPSGFQELEVRKGVDQSYGVSLQHKVCQCRLWELSGIPCVHAVAGYMHVGTDLDAGVSHWYSREAWFNAYQFSIKPVFGNNYVEEDKRFHLYTNKLEKCPADLRKKEFQPQGHNKASCKKDPQPKPEVEKKPPGRNKQVFVGQCASRGGSRSGRGDGNDGSGSGSGVNDASGSGVNAGSASGGRGGGRAGGSGGRGGGRAGGSGKRGGGRAGREESMEEAPMNQQYHEVFIPSIHSQPTQQSGVWVVDTTVSDDGPAVDKGKAKASVEDGPAPQQGISIEDGPAPKKKRGRPPSSVDGIRIHHKNRGRSERIANMKLNKPFQFDKFGTGSTPDKAFDVEE
ncbi:zinc finger, PMZ-type containing protein [Tanacetum coccineum]